MQILFKSEKFEVKLRWKLFWCLYMYVFFVEKPNKWNICTKHWVKQHYWIPIVSIDRKTENLLRLNHADQIHSIDINYPSKKILTISLRYIFFIELNGKYLVQNRCYQITIHQEFKMFIINHIMKIENKTVRSVSRKWIVCYKWRRRDYKSRLFRFLNKKNDSSFFFLLYR
jgi:hypothetical protein